MKKLLILCLIFISVFAMSKISLAKDKEGSLYDDPRHRYTITLPDEWSMLDDGRRDIFKVVRENQEAYLTIISFPPKEEEKTLDQFFKETFKILQPEKVLEQKSIKIMGRDGAVIDFIKKMDWFEINQKTIDELKDKISSDKLKTLQSLTKDKFSETDLTVKLLKSGFNKQDIETVLKEAKKNKVEDKRAFIRKNVYFIFSDKEVLTLTMEAPEEHFALFEKDFTLLKDSFKLTSESFGGALYMEPDGYYSLLLPFNWGIGPDTDTGVYFMGFYEKGIAFCDITKMAKPLATSDINVILDYWKTEIDKTDHEIKDTKTGFKISGQEAALLQHGYIQRTGKAHLVNDYIFMKDSYLFVISFDTEEDSYENFKNDLYFILNSAEINIK